MPRDLLRSLADVVRDSADADAMVVQQREGERNRPLVVQDLLPAVTRTDPRQHHNHPFVLGLLMTRVRDDLGDDLAVWVNDDLQRNAGRPRSPATTQCGRTILVLHAYRGDRTTEVERDVERVPGHPPGAGAVAAPEMPTRAPPTRRPDRPPP